MPYLFNNCNSLKKIIINNFDTNNVENMANMFSSCSNLQSLDITNFNTNNVKNISPKFRYDK